MPGRGSKRLKLSPGKVNGRRRASTRQPKQKPELDLPVELLAFILIRLNSRDKAQASSVCKKWRDVVASVRKLSCPPVLMCLRTESEHGEEDGGGPSFEYLDLSQRRKGSVRFSDRPHGVVYHANYGWMLFFEPVCGAMTFFHAETQRRLELPPQKFRIDGVAFSAPPTSPSCVVFTMRNSTRNNAEIITWQPGHTEWTTVHYRSDHSFYCCLWQCVLIRNGMFHCLSSNGGIGIYDPERSTWRVLDVQPLKWMASMTVFDRRQRVYMAECDGDIFMLQNFRVVQPVIYKLDEVKKKWAKAKNLGGATFFVHPINSIMRNDMRDVGPERDYVYFPWITSSGRSWVYYSLRHKMYNIRQQEFDPGRLDCYENIWIDFS